MIGAECLMVLASVVLSEPTPRPGYLYLGLVIFLGMVMYAPGGVASLIMMKLQVQLAYEPV
jgi:branched-chain amino acid transport system permease protein